MILKNFINFFNIYYLCLFLIFIYLINKFLFETKIRLKFTLLLILLILFSSISIYYNFDGLTMMFLVSELSVILIFIILFSQLYTFNYEKIKNFNTYLILVIIILNINYYEVSILSYKNYYCFNEILINDFFYIYNLYFEKQILITFITTIIITVYSIFFILLYYSLKTKLLSKNILTKNLYLLRKQNLIKQSNYTCKIKFFKK
jgi:hypothetical protein